VNLNEGVVDSDNVDVVVLNGISEDDTANTTETVDTDLERIVSFCGGMDVVKLIGDIGWRTLGTMFAVDVILELC